MRKAPRNFCRNAFAVVTVCLFYLITSTVVFASTDYGLHKHNHAFWDVRRHATSYAAKNSNGKRHLLLFVARGGESEEGDLEDKVYAAMTKLGLQQDNKSAHTSNHHQVSDEDKQQEEVHNKDNAQDERIAEEIMEEFTSSHYVTKSMVLAALAAAKGNATLAKEIIQYEVQLVSSSDVIDEELMQTLLDEGKYDKTMIQRALALSENNLLNARAILDAELEEEEEEEIQQRQDEEPLPTITVDVPANFDPAASSSTPPVQQNSHEYPLVFDVTLENLQSVVMESPIPVLIDVYATWCGPCKALTPILEGLCQKTKLFRLAKLNTDENKEISNLLKVSSLPTVFGVKDGLILNSFRGLPQSEEQLRTFILSIYDNNRQQEDQYKELSIQLAKIAGSSAYPFPVRERMIHRITHNLNELDVETSMETAQLLQKILSNIIQNPSDKKYRKLNLYRQIFAEKLTPYPPAIRILKIIGFHEEEHDDDSLIFLFGKTRQKVINIVPLIVGRDCIDKWLEKQHRRSFTSAFSSSSPLVETTAKLISCEDSVGEMIDTETERKDDKFKKEGDKYQDATNQDNTTTHVKFRLEGKNKIREVHIEKDTSLKDFIISHCSGNDITDKLEDVQITCTSKRLIIKLSDDGAMDKSFTDYGLFPSAFLVVKRSNNSLNSDSMTSIKERAVAKKKKQKKGSHTMQSIGIYAKDDNNKAELIDGGGGVWYEHDVSSDDEKEENGHVSEGEVDKN